METKNAKPNQSFGVRIAWIAILLFGLLLGGALTFLGIAYFGIRPFLIREYGSGIPMITEYVPGGSAMYAEYLPPKPEIGLHTISIEKDGMLRIVWLWVRDTQAPAALPLERTISTKTVLQPNELITNLTDASGVWVDFSEKPPFGAVGDYSVPIVLTDVAQNRTTVTSLLHIRILRDGGLVCEAGTEAPSARDFLCDDYDAALETEITEEMMRTPGSYPIRLRADGQALETLLTVRDTTAPQVRTRTVVRTPGSSVSPEEFLESVSDAGDTTAIFLSEPDLTSREFQEIPIRVTDETGNSTDVTAGLLFSRSTPIAIEARTTPLTAEECLHGTEYTDAVLIRSFTPSEPGMYAVSLQIDGDPQLAIVEVLDTVPPVLEYGSYYWYFGHPIEASRMVRVKDVSETTVSFATDVDWTLPKQTVTVSATDSAGNTATASFSLILENDTLPPVLHGITQRYLYLDEPFSYLGGVSAVDNADGEVPVSVDTSAVNPNQVGTYSVTYTATDCDGNTVSQTARVIIKKSTTSVEKLDRYVKKVSKQIFKDGMSLADKVFAVWDYVYGNIRYVEKSDKTDWRKEALRGLMYGKGDCFTANSVARALLEPIGAEVYSMQRHSFNTHHYWLLVNIGTGWYHFDANASREHGYQCRMWTDAQCAVMSGFWGYDKSASPVVATELFDKAAAEAAEAEWMKSHHTETDA